ncbi:unnamed protein product, partial [marine sediment metagenome]
MMPSTPAILAETAKWIVKDPAEEDVYWPSKEMKKRAWISDESIYEEAARDPVAFWAERAREGLDWYKEWDEAYKWEPPYF